MFLHATISDQGVVLGIRACPDSLSVACCTKRDKKVTRYITACPYTRVMVKKSIAPLSEYGIKIDPKNNLKN